VEITATCANITEYVSSLNPNLRIISNKKPPFFTISDIRNSTLCKLAENSTDIEACYNPHEFFVVNEVPVAPDPDTMLILLSRSELMSTEYCNPYDYISTHGYTLLNLTSCAQRLKNRTDANLLAQWQEMNNSINNPETGYKKRIDDLEKMTNPALFEFGKQLIFAISLCALAYFLLFTINRVRESRADEGSLMAHEMRSRKAIGGIIDRMKKWRR